MPAHAAWFQVNCPACTAALQVRLGEGSTRVACSDALECKAVFTVEVHSSMLKDLAAPAATTRYTVKSARALTAYNLFIKSETARLQRLDRTLDRKAAWSRAAAGWATSLMNPKAASAGATAAGATAGAMAAAATEVAAGVVAAAAARAARAGAAPAWEGRPAGISEGAATARGNGGAALMETEGTAAIAAPTQPAGRGRKARSVRHS